ncbi:MAG TPA: tetratricopeptide repeat protein, partial [Burkholderiales bacterium]|nr:tetratricopeptide repeat protein [Burkholderiales bacterium]
MTRFVRLLVLCLLVSGCVSDSPVREGQLLIDQGRIDEGIAQLEKTAREHPDNEQFRLAYVRARDLYVDQLLYEGEKARALGRHDQALAAFERAERLKPEEPRTSAGVHAARAEQAQSARIVQAQALLDAGRTENAQQLTTEVLKENPAHRAARALLRRIEEVQLQ